MKRFHPTQFRYLICFSILMFSVLLVLAVEKTPPLPVSIVGTNGMPKDIVPAGAKWNFGSGSLWTHNGWQYAAYWDDARQVSVARRQLQEGQWAVVSLPGYERTKTENRGKGGAISRGFGDSHEKVAMGISPDGVIHLAFDHHVSSLRYRRSKMPVANDSSAHPWTADLFGPVQDNLGGGQLEGVTYPGFTVVDSGLVLYMRLGGGSGGANSHYFNYTDGRWTVNTAAASQLIDKKWSGGDRTVNAYPHGLVVRNGRRHLTWCWRDTPDARTCHDLCYAYSDDEGQTWRNNDGKPIGVLGTNFITADSPGVAAVAIPPGSGYRNGGSMTVDAAGGVHVLVRGEQGKPVYFFREPVTGKWTRRNSEVLGVLLAGLGDQLYIVTENGVYGASAGRFDAVQRLVTWKAGWFEDSTMSVDRRRFEEDGWISVIGQQGKTVRVIDYQVGQSAARPSKITDLQPAEIAGALKRSADWQLSNPSGIDTRDWVIAPLYDGLFRLAVTTGDAKYLAAVLRFGTQSGWLADNRVYHADDHAVGHAWLDAYFMNTNRAERLAPMRERLDYVIANPITEALIFGQKPKQVGRAVTDRWTWCDALYMSPPTLARLHAATGDKKYLDFMDREYRYTYDMLWDKEEKLFFRDATFFDKKTPTGKKTFWSRGNGWVYGGLCLLLESLPKDHPTRSFYENLFQEMTRSVLAAQQADGLWRPSLLDPEQIPIGETSGSGFFTFGLAWGVNHGLLDREKHWPAIIRAWHGLLTRVKPDGYVGYVQPIGASPDLLTADSRQDYGTGAFLLAGSEVLRAVGGAAQVDHAALLAAAEQMVAEDKTPRAYARLVPERKDDLAWENDKVAFRVYGPALRAGAEDSGIDVWCKRVGYPILDKWYDADRLQKISYHQDHGEGYDGYHVGNTRGCGGLGLWLDGKLVMSDTYIAAEIIWTKPDVAEFKTVYEYPVKIDGKTIYENRITRLRLGERLTEIESFFSHTAGRGAKPIENFPHEIAIGIVTQNKGAQIKFDTEKGFASAYEQLDGKNLCAGLVLAPKRIVRTAELPAADKLGKNAHALLITRPDEKGRVIYRAGFAWEADGEIKTSAEWLAYLTAQAAKQANTQ